MRFMEAVQTTNGPGKLVGRGEGGQVLVVHGRKDLSAPPGNGPCFHRFYQWCGRCRVGFEEQCPVCGTPPPAPPQNAQTAIWRGENEEN